MGKGTLITMADIPMIHNQTDLNDERCSLQSNKNDSIEDIL
jgi:hypothetical protein